ncbi:homing endonuclease associated repeat-containing protein [candidate division KSB1 bacterium]
MAVNRYTNDEIINLLKNLSRKLGRKQISQKDISTVLPISAVRYRFGNVVNALEAAGLERHVVFPKRKTLTEDELFRALYETEIMLGREPIYFDCRSRNKYSISPYKTRYGKWVDVLAHYRSWKENNKETLASIRDSISNGDGLTPNNRHYDGGAVKSPLDSCDPDIRPTPGQLYGEPLDFRGLRHAPTNEQGVVFLFALVSRELGFNVEFVRQGFPDCEAKYLFDSNKNLWARASLEFEYRASLFKDHNHDPQKCEFIVCWIDDWPDCPLNVIELKTEIMKLPTI